MCAALFRHSLPLFFARIFPAPSAAGVLWVAVAHPLLMHRRAPHACASCSQDISLSFHVAAIRYVPLLDLPCSAPLCATPRAAARCSVPTSLEPMFREPPLCLPAPPAPHFTCSPRVGVLHVLMHRTLCLSRCTAAKRRTLRRVLSPSASSTPTHQTLFFLSTPLPLRLMYISA